MVYTKYDVRFTIIHQGKMMGSLDFVTPTLKDVFDGLYEEVVASSCIDPLTDQVKDPVDWIHEIHISISKKRVKG